MSREISHVVSRCVNCSGLHKMRFVDYCKSLLQSYNIALANEENELVILCDSCREKMKQHIA